MKNKGLILSVMMLIWMSASVCNAQTTTENEDKEGIAADKVEVFYFHYSRRCATCTAVETESEKALKELYPEQVESGEVMFLSIDIEEESNEAMAEEYKVSGQTLLVVKGDKQKNLTNTAFMYATTNPEKLKKEIEKAVSSL